MSSLIKDTMIQGPCGNFINNKDPVMDARMPSSSDGPHMGLTKAWPPCLGPCRGPEFWVRPAQVPSTGFSGFLDWITETEGSVCISNVIRHWQQQS